MGSEKKRVNVTLGADFYNLLKQKADLMGSSVPSLLVFYAMEHMYQQNMIDGFPALLERMKEFEQFSQTPNND